MTQNTTTPSRAEAAASAAARRRKRASEEEEEEEEEKGEVEVPTGKRRRPMTKPSTTELAHDAKAADRAEPGPAEASDAPDLLAPALVASGHEQDPGPSATEHDGDDIVVVAIKKKEKNQ